MGYSDNPARVRVDFFKDNGKWYTTEAVEMMDWSGETYTTFQRSLKAHLNGRLKGMWAVCLDPYSDKGFPLMVRVEGAEPYNPADDPNVRIEDVRGK